MDLFTPKKTMNDFKSLSRDSIHQKKSETEKLLDEK